ncbi:hypothetical protein NHH82_20910 [Oxalobacteraceae bacterium OTU3REALA1]|nr:hypothetical protein NHH82_20910 [Oxalobacteraceae bacterium OTU3REALA1]
MQATTALPSKNNLLHHFLWLRAALGAAGAEAILDFDSFDVLVRRGPRQWALYPKFLTGAAGAQRYSAAPAPDAAAFAGWLPYRHKHWPLAADKLAFKRYARETLLPVPEYATDPDAALRDVIVKRANASFGAAIAGPFRASAERRLDPAHGEFYERYIEGKILKIWYWEGRPLCLEMDAMPSVRGDGGASIGELILRRASLHQALGAEQRRALLDGCAALLRYHGATVDDVPARGRRQTVEFRYGSTLLHPRARTLVDLRGGGAEPGAQAGGTAALAAPLLELLRTAGVRLREAIPAGIRRHTLFTVDAVLDADERAWLLEMNSNPAVHPLAYPAIAASVLDDPES